MHSRENKNYLHFVQLSPSDLLHPQEYRLNNLCKITRNPYKKFGKITLESCPLVEDSFGIQVLEQIINNFTEFFIVILQLSMLIQRFKTMMLK